MSEQMTWRLTGEWIGEDDEPSARATFTDLVPFMLCNDDLPSPIEGVTLKLERFAETPPPPPPKKPARPTIR